MHPPDFSFDHALLDWPECWLEVRCPCSQRVTNLPVRMLAARNGARPFRAILAALRCSACRSSPAPAYLVAGQTRTFNFGPRASWALELVPSPR